MIRTRPFTAADKGAFLVLYRECLGHYGIPPATPAQEARVIELLISGRHMSCLLALDAGRAVGFATWALTLPAGAGVALYMKEIFVSHGARGTGAGRALLAGLLDIAQAEGCTRLDWQTDAGNLESQRFYARLGAPMFDKKTYRVTDADFTRFRARIVG